MLALCHYCLFGWHCAHFNFIFVCLSCHMSICVSVSNILLTLRPLYCSPLKPSSSWVKGRLLTLPFLKHFFLSLLEVKLKVRVGVKLQWHKKVQILVRSPIVWVSFRSIWSTCFGMTKELGIVKTVQHQQCIFCSVLNHVLTEKGCVFLSSNFKSFPEILS